MNRWERSIASITDDNLKKIADDSLAECVRLRFRCEVASFTGHDTTQDAKLCALMAILKNFAKRELDVRKKAKNKKTKNGKKENE